MAKNEVFNKLLICAASGGFHSNTSILKEAGLPRPDEYIELHDSHLAGGQKIPAVLRRLHAHEVREDGIDGKHTRRSGSSQLLHNRVIRRCNGAKNALGFL